MVKVNWSLVDVTVVTVYDIPVWNVNARPSMSMLTEIAVSGGIVGPDQLLLAYWVPVESLA